jgi:hypothetical protein
MPRNAKPKQSVVESIIFLQSLFLVAFGIAGFMAASTVVAGMLAITDASSSVALITNGSLVTENTSVSIDEAKHIIGNFEIVCTSSLVIGLVVVTASVIRLALRAKQKDNG